mgnify:CR=1 FL=1
MTKQKSFIKVFFKVSGIFIAFIIAINLLFLLAQEIYYLPYTIQIIQLKRWIKKYEPIIKEEQQRVNLAVNELREIDNTLKLYSKKISLGQYHLIDKYNAKVNEYYYIAKNYEGLFEQHKRNSMIFEQNSEKLKKLVKEYGKRRFLLFLPFKFKYEVKKENTTYTISKK